MNSHSFDLRHLFTNKLVISSCLLLKIKVKFQKLKAELSQNLTLLESSTLGQKEITKLRPTFEPSNYMRTGAKSFKSQRRWSLNPSDSNQVMELWIDSQDTWESAETNDKNGRERKDEM